MISPIFAAVHAAPDPPLPFWVFFIATIVIALPACETAWPIQRRRNGLDSRSGETSTARRASSPGRHGTPGCTHRP